MTFPKVLKFASCIIAIVIGCITAGILLERPASLGVSAVWGAICYNLWYK